MSLRVYCHVAHRIGSLALATRRLWLRRVRKVDSSLTCLAGVWLGDHHPDSAALLAVCSGPRNRWQPDRGRAQNTWGTGQTTCLILSMVTQYAGACLKKLRIRRLSSSVKCDRANGMGRQDSSGRFERRGASRCVGKGGVPVVQSHRGRLMFLLRRQRPPVLDMRNEWCERFKYNSGG